MKVSEYMTRKLQTARPDEGVRSVFFRMRRERIRHIPVVTGGGQLAGWISDRDLRRPDWADPSVDLSHGYQLDDQLEAADVMNPHPVVVHTYDPMRKAVDIMRERHFGALPVLDKRDQVVGVLSAHDALRAFAELLDTIEAEKTS
ncbi:MAG: CBS domain-containing protein [Deltaproteobacteria bacterium]|nr:CBS domain-containing protein [Deltaproteobacteria bacterium]